MDHGPSAATALLHHIARALPTLLRHVRVLIVRMVGTTMGATFALFVLLEVSLPGGFRAVVLPNGETASDPRAKPIIDRYHLDDNILVRYGHWLFDAVQGDFGQSIQRKGTLVTDTITHRLPISLQLMLVGVALTVLIGIPFGMVAAIRARHASGTVLNWLMSISQALPVYLSPIILIYVFVLRLGWFPASGWIRISDSLTGNLKNMILPVSALAIAEIGIVARIVRGDAQRVLEEDYIAAAVSKGLSAPYIMFRHVLRPASLGLLNIVGMNIGSLLGGALVIEIIFGIGGLGQVLLEATLNRDLPLLLGLTTYAVGVYVLVNTIVDALMFFLDPRTRRT